ncbi:MAG: hypothetical protein WDM78_01770 [Puia sp.]
MQFNKSCDAALFNFALSSSSALPPTSFIPCRNVLPQFMVLFSSGMDKCPVIALLPINPSSSSVNKITSSG